MRWRNLILTLLPLVPEAHEYATTLVELSTTLRHPYGFGEVQVWNEPDRWFRTPTWNSDIQTQCRNFVSGSAKRRQMRLPSLALSSACCTQQRSLPLTMGAPLWRFSSTRRSTRYNAYLLAATAGAPTIRESRCGWRCSWAAAQILVTLGGLKAMIEVPRRALARIKRFLRRACRKPADMPIRTHLAFPTS
jgi:hypothetical protein